MKKIVYLLLLGLAGCQQEGVITEVPKDDWSVVANTAGQVKGQVNIKFKELPEDLQIVTTRSGVDTDNGQLNFVIRQLGGTRLERVFPHAGKFEARTRKAGLHLWYQVSFDENIPTAEAMKALSELPNVSIVEPIYKGKTESVSLPYNDPYLPRQWHLYNDGSNGMLAGADISILDAWEIEKGKPEVIVNVVDSKVDLNHEDLRDNLWKNPGEFNQNPWGDNDGNGYQGDWHGIGANPVTGVAEDDHGTHVAGILAAKNNNGVGICGVAGGDTPDNGVRFMCCPFNNGNPAASIKYGADHGAVICTNSWFIAGGSVAEVMQDAVNYFVKNAGIDENGNQTGPMRGGIVFGSAGNDGVEPESHYPASLDNVIAVAALDPAFKKSDYSNYAEWVDIAAPGGGNGYGWQMWSCARNNNYLELVGTSQATPVAAGVAALIVSKFAREGLTPYEVEYRLKRGVKPIDDYNPEYKGKIAVTDITSSSTAWLLIQGLISEYGEEEAKEILTDIYANAGDHLEESGSGPLKLVRAGEVAIGFGLRQQAVADKEKGLPVDYIDPEEGNFTLTETVAVVNKSEEKNAKAMEMAECIIKNGREELLKSYPIPLYEGESVPETEKSGNPKTFPEKLTVDLLKKHQELSESCKK